MIHHNISSFLDVPERNASFSLLAFFAAAPTYACPALVKFSGLLPGDPLDVPQSGHIDLHSPRDRVREVKDVADGYCDAIVVQRNGR